MAAIDIEAVQTTGAGVYTDVNKMYPVDTALHTNGQGYWSNKITQVRVIGMALGYVDDDNTFGELRVFFDTNTWDTMEDGLIYTDDAWIRALQEFLAGQGLTGRVDYSEQGMQGDNFVSCDVDGEFLAAWQQVFG